jgi:hypothetical protein
MSLGALCSDSQKVCVWIQLASHRRISWSRTPSTMTQVKPTLIAIELTTKTPPPNPALDLRARANPMIRAKNIGGAQ